MASSPPPPHTGGRLASLSGPRLSTIDRPSPDIGPTDRAYSGGQTETASPTPARSVFSSQDHHRGWPPADTELEARVGFTYHWFLGYAVYRAASRAAGSSSSRAGAVRPAELQKSSVQKHSVRPCSVSVVQPSDLSLKHPRTTLPLSNTIFEQVLSSVPVHSFCWYLFSSSSNSEQDGRLSIELLPSSPISSVLSEHW